MKKLILLIVCLLCVGGGIFYYTKDQPDQNPEQEKMKWCYGVYHETKSSSEMRDHDIWIHFSPIYKDMESSRSFKKGKSEAHQTSAEQRTECYDLVYPMLAELQHDKGSLSDVVPYCFGYLEKAREATYVPVFCEQTCKGKRDTECVSGCNADFGQNLRQFPLNQGREDAAKRVNPAQFVHCIEVLKGIM